jgi:hypothetical protein
MADLYKGIAGSPITYLAADISANQTTISIDDDSALPDAPNICTIGYGEQLETIKYGAKSNGVLQNVTRGIEGTPRAWPAGTEVARFFTAYDHNAIIENFNSHLAEYTQLIESGYKSAINLDSLLVNGWSGQLRCVRNKLGQVYLWGNLTVGVTTGGTAIATLPENLRPISNSQPVLGVKTSTPANGNVTGIALLSSNGDMHIYGGLQGAATGDSIRIAVLYQAGGV